MGLYYLKNSGRLPTLYYIAAKLGLSKKLAKTTIMMAFFSAIFTLFQKSGVKSQE